MRRMRPLAAFMSIALFLVLAFAPSIVRADEPANTSGQESANAPALEINSPKELDGKTIGIISGSNFDQLIRQSIDIDYELMYFNTYSDIVSALKARKVDALIANEPTGVLVASRNEGIGVMPETITKDDYGFFFRKGDPLANQFSTIIESLSADGTLDALKNKWCGSNESAKTLPAQDWEPTNGTLRMATTGEQEPLTYVSGSQTIGYDIEVAMLCCKQLGYGLSTQNQSVPAILASVEAGKSDFGGGGISITEERKKTYDFTVPDYHGAVVAVVRTANDDTAKKDGFFEGMVEDFNSTFIKENRWQLFAGGMVVTVLISLVSGTLGILLGYATVLARRGGVRWVGKLVDGYQALMGGVPIVVVLMVLYYVVFGSINIEAEIVAVIAFALSFGATAGATMWTSVSSVDAIQEECGLALSYTRREVFRKIIFPLARRKFTPQLMGQVVSLVKETSVVGYIAVEDLTRAGDLVRARTMDAFFPLISTAVIYFLFCRLITRVLNALASRFDDANRPRRIEGINEA